MYDEMEPIQEVPELIAQTSDRSREIPPPQYFAEYVDTSGGEVYILNVGTFLQGKRYRISQSEATLLATHPGFVVSQE